MPIERLAWLVLAVGVAATLLIGAPVSLPEGWDKAAHFVAFSALTLCLWQASAGTMPRFVLAAVIALAALDEWRQAYLPDRVSDAGDFLADLFAVAVTGALLFMQRTPACAESSPR
jgi:VanZ family protein